MSSTGTVGSVDKTFGCLTIGTVLSMGLWGAGSVQTYYFFHMYGASDSVYLKLQVFVIWALNTVHQAFILCSMYRHLVTYYAVVEQLAKLDATLRDAIIVTGVIAVLAQSIFVDRIYYLSKNLIVTGVMATLAFGQLACAVAYFAEAYPSATFTELRSNPSLMHADKIVTAIVNTAFAITLVYLFHTTRTGFKPSDTSANKCVAFVVNTGAVTALCAILCMITSFAFPDAFVYLLFYFVLSRLYMNSVLSSLNSRSMPRDRGNNSSNTPLTMHDMRNNRPELSSQVRPTVPRVVTIKVDTETFLDNERHKGLSRADSDGDMDMSYSKASRTAY